MVSNGTVIHQTQTSSSDGYFMRGGKVMAFRNGQLSEITTEQTLDNGARISSDGTIIFADGRRDTFRDGQWLFIDGRMAGSGVDSSTQTIPAGHLTTTQRDGYFMKDGKAFMSRNGSMSEVQSEMTLTDGTRIFVDGTVITKDGSNLRLSETQILGVDGKFTDSTDRVKSVERPEVTPNNVNKDRFNEQNRNQNTQNLDQKSIPENQPNLNSKRNDVPAPAPTPAPADLKNDVAPADINPANKVDSTTLPNTPAPAPSQPVEDPVPAPKVETKEGQPNTTDAAKTPSTQGRNAEVTKPGSVNNQANDKDANTQGRNADNKAPGSSTEAPGQGRNPKN